MATTTWETGLLLGEFPYIRIGNVPHNLLVVPGTQVDNVDPGFIVGKTYRAAYATFARNHTLYLVNRKRDLPPTYTSEDMAADYVRVLHEIRRFAELLITLAERGRGADIETELGAGLFTGQRSQRVMRHVMQIGGKVFVSPPGTAMISSPPCAPILRSIRAHSSRRCASRRSSSAAASIPSFLRRCCRKSPISSPTPRCALMKARGMG